MNVLGIIPARGGSKGIPRKNLALCAGKPLVKWTLDAAHEASLVDHVLLSSDDEEILEQGLFTTNKSKRPFALSQDDSTTEGVLAYEIDQVGPYLDFDAICLLQPTSPLRTGRHIDEAISLLNEGYDSVVSVVPSHSYLWRGGDYPFPLCPTTGRLPRQQMAAQYEENGAIYVTTLSQWERTHNRYGGRVALYVMEEEQRLQVDTPHDLWLAEQMLFEREVAHV